MSREHLVRLNDSPARLITDFCRAMHICRRAVSRCLPVMFVYSVETAEDTAVVAMECE